jgi:hypothetical protein
MTYMTHEVLSQELPRGGNSLDFMSLLAKSWNMA